MYFKNFGQIYYDFEINGKRELKVVTDITQNVRFRKELLSNITRYDLYDIQEGETPEIIAEKLYGNPQYHWIIMLVNDRYDYITDFPLAQYELEQSITSKYGAGNEYDTHHYVNSEGFIVNSDDPTAYPVSNYEYEDSVNESKRRIKIVSKDLIDTILKNFSELV
jgi:hypothetical protein